MRIPGTDQDLVVSLFADDTSVYLSSSDSLETLWEILHLWCAASTAKFNDHKTVILPFGTPAFRTMVLQERRLNKRNRIGLIENNIRIVPDGDTCRLLGAWIGNIASYTKPWPSIIEKINRDLERWRMSSPTLEGRRHIVNMVIGGRTQYLTRVQGMPKNVEHALIKIEQIFLWDEKTARVGHERMMLNIADGGKQILDIPARNETIDLWNLQTYLVEGPARAAWCYFVAFMLKDFLEKSYLTVRPGEIFNVLMQDIHIPISSRTSLPDDIKTTSRYPCSATAVDSVDFTNQINDIIVV
jgi:hypothetical protein